MVNKLVYNKSIRAHLVDLAGLSPTIGPVELAAAGLMICISPAKRVPSSILLRRGSADSESGKACFNDHELQTLAKFHEVFASEIDTLPNTGEWKQDPGWQRVGKAARAALDQLETPSAQPE